MRLLSFNVGLYEKNNRQLPGFFRTYNADFLCLQEVTNAVGDKAKQEFISKPAIDSGSENLSYGFYAPNWQTNSHKTSRYHDDPKYQLDWGGVIEFGNYVKSRFPILFATNIYVENHFSFVTNWTNWPEQDYRAVQVVDLAIDGHPLRILNYHGIWTRDKKGNAKTLSANNSIKNLAGEAKAAIIIAGDFNLFPDTESMKIVSNTYESLVDTFKIKSTRPQSNELNKVPRNVVDYIFINKHIRVVDFQVIESDVSDHLALRLDFNL